jgi:hypothetical protein
MEVNPNAKLGNDQGNGGPTVDAKVQDFPNAVQNVERAAGELLHMHRFFGSLNRPPSVASLTRPPALLRR